MIRVITDSVATLPAGYADDCDVLTLYLRHDGQEYEDATMDVDAFYSKIASMAKNPPMSSQPSTAAFQKAFEDAAMAGDQALGVLISTGLSGTFDQAVRVARAVGAQHADFRFALVDSTSCGGDEGFPVAEAVDAVKRGRSLSHCAQEALLGVQSSRFLFVPQTLEFLKEGGRIGRASSLLGSLVHINPVLTVTDGTVRVVSKARGVRRALRTIMKSMADDVERAGGLKRVIVHYIGDKAPAAQWAHEAVEPFAGHPVDVRPVSPVIGAHVGPAVGVAYECNRPLSDKVTGNVQDRLCTS